ncbi:glycosyltransferase [Segetibacter aerophilus]|uniref:Glycosyl transferase family 1 domain-containing protein n=1 Tax=Segetibacter aerophilus TaxID=670293 RepID=A0A512BH02_9BACT|nr:glycosyltransferase [Segetibacter aerophilus]GEO11240.1 hypothetical protein SAE01_37360 [Segetibacter aerophilus]
MKKITWCAVARAPYLDYLHTEVDKHFDLKVFYKIKERTHPWELDQVHFKNKNIDGNLLKVLSLSLRSDLLIISGWAFWQHLILMLFPMGSTKKIYWTDTPNLDKQKWSGIKGYIRRIIIKIVFNVFDEVWSTGTPGCEALEKLGCDKKKIRSFTFFFDLNRYTNISPIQIKKALAFKKRNINSDNDVIFLCAGQVISKKRFENAIEAIRRLNNRNVVLWIAGTGPQEEELKRFAIELNVLSQVKFLGWLQQDEVELAFISSDVFVHPSHFDPFPIVVLDAMTWAKPIIATIESGSAKDRVIDGISGFLYPSGQVETLANRMQYFVDNKKAIKEFGLEARKTACSYPVEWAIERLRSVVR